MDSRGMVDRGVNSWVDSWGVVDRMVKGGMYCWVDSWRVVN